MLFGSWGFFDAFFGGGGLRKALLLHGSRALAQIRLQKKGGERESFRFHLYGRKEVGWKTQDQVSCKNNCKNSCQALVLSLLSLLVQKYKYS